MLLAIIQDRTAPASEPVLPVNAHPGFLMCRWGQGMVGGNFVSLPNYQVEYFFKERTKGSWWNLKEVHVL